MWRRRLLSIGLALFFVVGSGTATAKRGDSASIRLATQAVTEGMARTDARLNDLLAQVPHAAAKEGIRRAIEANLTGHTKALDALEHARDPTLAGLKTEARIDAGQADAEGVVGARMALREGAVDTKRALKEAMAKADRRTRATIRAALSQVRRGNAQTLAQLDGVRLGRSGA